MSRAGPARAVRRLAPGSLLGKIVGALLGVLLLATALTAAVDWRLTRAAVDRQAEQVASGNLAVLREAFAQREHDLVVQLRTLAATLAGTPGIADPARRAELIAQLGAAAPSLGLDVLEVVDRGGRPLVPPVSIGRLRIEQLGRHSAAQPVSRLLRSTSGPFVQAVPVPIGPGAGDLVLVGGLEFGDELAYQLRNQLGGLTDVLLVVAGNLVGTTLSTVPTAPPGLDRRASALPERPVPVDLGRTRSLVAYAPVSRSADDPAGGALGVALADPARPLNDALAANRVLASAALMGLVVLFGWLLFRRATRPLVALAATATEIAGGELDARFEPGGSEEVARLATALEHMRTNLLHELDLVERQAAELREMSRRVVAAQDDERQRLARDLHDGLQQELVLLRVRAGLGQAAATRAGAADAAGHLAELGQELEATIQRVREVSHDLYPSILRDRGLVPALRSTLGRLPLPARLECRPAAAEFPRLPPSLESGAYFLVSEALTNALKHAGASELVVEAAVDDGRLSLCVTDDGRGFDPAGAPGGGLVHLHDRARSLGGTLEVDSRRGRGTRVSATIPVPVAPAPPATAPRPAAAAP